MPSIEPEQTQRAGRRSCLSYGCMASAALFVILVLWIGSGFMFWKQCRIPLPDGSGAVVYMAKLNKIMCAEWDRKVRFETNRFSNRDRLVPNDTCGGYPVNAYWYPAKNGAGPYIRFCDPLTEYIVDCAHGTTLLVARRTDVAYVGEITAGPLSYGTSGPIAVDGKRIPGTETAEVNGRPARKLESRVASKPGLYLGRIERAYNRFVPREESPEAALPKH